MTDGYDELTIMVEVGGQDYGYTMQIAREVSSAEAEREVGARLRHDLAVRGIAVSDAAWGGRVVRWKRASGEPIEGWRRWAG